MVIFLLTKRIGYHTKIGVIVRNRLM